MSLGRKDPCPCGSGKKFKKCCEGKVASRPAVAQPELNQLVALLHAGRFNELERHLHLILQHKSDWGDGWKLLGASLGLQGKSALRPLQKAARLLPDDAEVHYNLGLALQELGQLDEAAVSFRRSLTLNPNDPDAHNDLGNALQELGAYDAAVASYRRALVLRPMFSVAHNNLGCVFHHNRQFKAAVASYQKALAINPVYTEAHNNLGLAFKEAGHFEEALSYFRQAIVIDPKYVVAHNNLGNVLQELGRLNAAIDSYRQALAFKPFYAEAHYGLGYALQCLGHIDAAIASYRRALAYKPNYFKALSSTLCSFNFSPKYAEAYCFEEARKFGRMVTWNVSEKYSSWHCHLEPKRLRVGLLLGDSCNHSAESFLESLLSHLDTDKVELFAYSSLQKTDGMPSRIQKYFVVWKSIDQLQDVAAAQMIHADAVNILVDLSGHTEHNRLPIFGWQPAPVQVSWLGYSATTGVAEIDFIVADKVGIPENRCNQFTEMVWYLPDSNLCFTPPSFDFPLSPLPALGNGQITFGCFQSLSKVNDVVLAVWSKILAALPDARLRIANKQFGELEVVSEFTNSLIQQGIDPARLELLGVASRESYLELFSEVDLLLDTFPCSGRSMTCEALWMGVPTLTLAGDTLLSRQGASILTAAGLSDWIATSEAEYVEKAIRFANNLLSLADLRDSLRAQVLVSPIFDAQRFARNFEDALWGMWRHKHGRKQVNACRLLDEDLKNIVPVIEVVSATRLSEQAFWNSSALGISLRRVMQDRRIVAHITYENNLGLSEVFNARINTQDGKDILIFMHDDVWIDDCLLADKVIEGLEIFDVIGVAGNRRRVSAQPGWIFIDAQLTSDRQENLSGAIAHGAHPSGLISIYGERSLECELLDGVFIAAKKSRLISNTIGFDPQFKFHFYDMDFCRSARSRGLHLGTWPINLTHQSMGNFGGKSWQDSYRLYLEKWEN